MRGACHCFPGGKGVRWVGFYGGRGDDELPFFRSEGARRAVVAMEDGRLRVVDVRDVDVRDMAIGVAP